MDRLDTLPKSSTKMTPQEKNVMTAYFGGDQDGGSATDDSDAGEESEVKTNWKALGYILIAFVALANPWIDALICKLPYCEENRLAGFGVKVVAFALSIFIITRYMAPSI